MGVGERFLHDLIHLRVEIQPLAAVVKESGDVHLNIMSRVIFEREHLIKVVRGTIFKNHLLHLFGVQKIKVCPKKLGHKGTCWDVIKANIHFCLQHQLVPCPCQFFKCKCSFQLSLLGEVDFSVFYYVEFYFPDDSLQNQTYHRLPDWLSGFLPLSGVCRDSGQQKSGPFFKR